MMALRQIIRVCGLVGCIAIALVVKPVIAQDALPAVEQPPEDAPTRVDPDDLVPPPFESHVEALPRSGLGGVIIEPGMVAVDISNAVALYLPPAETDEATPAFATYLIDFVNRAPRTQTRILVLDPGIYGGPGAPATLNAPALVTADVSDAAALIEVIETGVRTRVRLEIPAGETVTAAFRFSAPVNALAVEMWGEQALARFDTAALVLQGALLGLVTALGAWLAGVSVLRRDRLAGWLSALFGVSFLALLTGFGFSGPFALAGVVTNTSAALGFFVLASAVALAFVVHALAPDGRWRGFGWIAAYAPWLIATVGLLTLFNFPHIAMLAKATAGLGLALAAIVIFARAWEGDAAARRLALAAVFVLLAFAPLAMLEAVDASGRVTMLAACGLLSAALLLAAFATTASAPPALRQRVDRLTTLAVREPPPPPPPLDLPPPPPMAGEDARFGLAMAAAHQGVWDWDLKRDRLFLSPSVEQLLGVRPGQLAAPGRDWNGHIHEDDIATFLGALEEYRRIGDVSFVLDFRGLGADGVYRWVQLRASFMSDGDRAARCVGLASDVSAQKESEALLLASARQDPVSGLANRAFFLEALGNRLAFAAADRAYAVLALDVARFRTVNDGLGPAAGDALLAVLGDRLREHVPQRALSARLGGDVFAVVWPCADADEAAESAKAMLDALGPTVDLSGRRVTPVVRGGLAMFDGAMRDPAQALGDAEAALAEARRAGRTTLVLFAPPMRSSKTTRAVLERDLLGALDRGEIVLHYQPIVRVADESLAGFEALLRWRHPERGLLTAEAFAPLAEETGLIEPLGLYALQTAAHDIARWRRILPEGRTLFVNVNVSAHQLGSESFLLSCEALGNAGLRLEITETLAISDAAAADAALSRLHKAGFALVMDDFGAGHSTPRRLAHLPFDAVKIDRAFLAGGGPARGVLAGLIRLASDLGLEATVEGVESAEDLAFLVANGCDYAQGYHCGMPRDTASTQALVIEAFQITAEAPAAE